MTTLRALKENLLLDTDSYKMSHPWQFPKGMTGAYYYLSSRGGRFGRTLFFGLQYLLRGYFEGRVITKADVEEAAEFAAAHGEPFPLEGWMRVVEFHDGRLPLKIRAVAEGTVVPTHNVLLTCESTDPSLAWLPGWFETQLVRLWYPTTVATLSFHIKKTISEYLHATANDPSSELPFKLHDFGSRGASSRETAAVGGMAHLVNFKGSDTVVGVRHANWYYDEPMSAFSIPAAEHSTITSWGRSGEKDAYRNMLKEFGKPGKIFACVSDSYDLYDVVENVWGDELRDAVTASGATLVIRPDSGNPADVVLTVLQILERKVGMEKNLRGYKVLPKAFRVIQGDGVNQDSITDILHTMKSHAYSASNIAFGMGGALLQQMDRDTQKFAYKMSEAIVNGAAVPVSKDPVTDPGKRSLAGRLALVRRSAGFQTLQLGTAMAPSDDLLETVFENGKVLTERTLAEIRTRSELFL